MNHQFPPDETLGQQHVISLSTHSPDLLTLAQGDSYPLIIRMETLTEQAAAEGRQLQQVSQVWGMGTTAVMVRLADTSAEDLPSAVCLQRFLFCKLTARACSIASLMMFGTCSMVSRVQRSRLPGEAHVVHTDACS